MGNVENNYNPVGWILGQAFFPAGNLFDYLNPKKTTPAAFNYFSLTDTPEPIIGSFTVSDHHLTYDCGHYSLATPGIDEIYVLLDEAARSVEQYHAKRQQALAEYVALLRRDAGRDLLARGQFTLEEVLAVIETSQSDDSLYDYPAVTFQILFHAELKRNEAKRAWRWARALIVRTYKLVPRFCAVGWFQRFWFLLHGSHPPKTQAPSFCSGCAY